MSESIDGGPLVVHFESRRAIELDALIRRHGGHPVSAPALSELPIPAGESEREVLRRLAKGEFDIVVLLTGVGAARLFDEAQSAGYLDETLHSLERATIVARGPKPAFTLRQRGLKAAHIVSEPNTTSELLLTLESIEVQGSHVLVVHAGETFDEPSASLRARGADVVELQVYQWALGTTDAARLGEVLRELISGRADAVIFTSQVQIRHVFDVAARDGLTDALTEALRGAVIVGAVGPTCAAALRERGIEPDIVPDHPKMGHLVAAVAKQLSSAGVPR